MTKSLGSRRSLALLVVCTLLLRGLIPQGFMPAAGAGAFTVELCPAGGMMPPALAAYDAGGIHPRGAPRHSADPGGPHHASCVFSTGASAAFAAALAVSAPVAPLPARVTAPPGAREHVPAILRAQSPRAPPLAA